MSIGKSIDKPTPSNRPDSGRQPYPDDKARSSSPYPGSRSSTMTSRDHTGSDTYGFEVVGDGHIRSFLVPPDMAALAVLRQHLLSALSDVLSPGDLDLYVVAISEAATNALEAHCRRGLTEPVTVTVDLSSARTTVDDRGGGIDPSTAEPAEVAPSAVRGRGLLIMRGICPGLEVEQTDSGVTVVLPFPT